MKAEHTVSGFGYQGRSPAELQRLAEEQDAVVVDVRLKPWSRLPGWSRKALQALLGERYVWVPELGNKNCKQDITKAELVDEATGMAKAREILREHAVILLCYEADESQCHRELVRRRLELPEQPGLF